VIIFEAISQHVFILYSGGSAHILYLTEENECCSVTLLQCLSYIDLSLIKVNEQG